MADFKEGNPDKPCCGGGCPVYKFDFETAVDSADWTVDIGTVTFNANTIQLGPGAKITLNAATLAGNNYAATMSVSSAHTAADLQLHLADASSRIDYDSGDFTFTLNNGTADDADSGTNATQVNPALGICLNGSTLTGWSGWTYQSGNDGYGHTRATYGSTLSGSLSIQNHGADTVTVSGLELTQSVIGDAPNTVSCQDCSPSGLCTDCANGWAPNWLAYTVSNRQHGLPPCHASLIDAQAAMNDCGPLPGDDYNDTIGTAGNPCTLGKEMAVVRLFSEGTSFQITETSPGCWVHGCSTPLRYSELTNVFADYREAAGNPMYLELIVSEHDDDGTTHSETQYTLRYEIGVDDCWVNHSLTIADFDVEATLVKSGTQVALSAETLAIGIDTEPSL